MNGTLPGLCVHSTELVRLKGDSPTGYIFITLPAWLNILGSFFFLNLCLYSFTTNLKNFKSLYVYIYGLGGKGF